MATHIYDMHDSLLAAAIVEGSILLLNAPASLTEGDLNIIGS